MNITLIEGGKQVLGSMSEKAGKKAAKYLDKFGVEVRLGVILKSYEDYVAVMSDGSEIRTNCLIWAAGVEGNLVPGLYDGAVVNGRIIVDEYNLIKGHKYIYAVGDVALQVSEKYPKGLPMLAPVALQQAKHLAQNILRTEDQKALKPFVYTNKGTMATIGRNRAVVDMPFNIVISGFLGWFIWMFIHLFSIIGFRRKLLVFANWMWNYFTYNQGNRLIIKKDIDD